MFATNSNVAFLSDRNSRNIILHGIFLQGTAVTQMVCMIDNLHITVLQTY